ncbi:MAG: hypothetical protein MK102_06950 [Fuerstiella sp.]|nr:hypothetical protein [Fuerstiella sp.]
MTTSTGDSNLELDHDQVHGLPNVSLPVDGADMGSVDVVPHLDSNSHGPGVFA